MHSTIRFTCIALTVEAGPAVTKYKIRSDNQSSSHSSPSSSSSSSIIHYHLHLVIVDVAVAFAVAIAVAVTVVIMVDDVAVEKVIIIPYKCTHASHRVDFNCALVYESCFNKSTTLLHRFETFSSNIFLQKLSRSLWGVPGGAWGLGGPKRGSAKTKAKAT